MNALDFIQFISIGIVACGLLVLEMCKAQLHLSIPILIQHKISERNLKIIQLLLSTQLPQPYLPITNYSAAL